VSLISCVVIPRGASLSLSLSLAYKSRINPRRSLRSAKSLLKCRSFAREEAEMDQRLLHVEFSLADQGNVTRQSGIFRSHANAPKSSLPWLFGNANEWESLQHRGKATRKASRPPSFNQVFTGSPGLSFVGPRIRGLPCPAAPLLNRPARRLPLRTRSLSLTETRIVIRIAAVNVHAHTHARACARARAP